MLYPALIRLKVFSAAMLAPQKTASLKTEGSHRGVQHPRTKGAPTIADKTWFMHADPKPTWTYLQRVAERVIVTHVYSGRFGLYGKAVFTE